MSATAQQIPDDTRVVLEELITEPGVDWRISDGQPHPAHRTRDGRLAAHLLDETAFIESCLLGGTASPSPWTAASVPYPAGVVGPHRDLDPVAGADLGQQAGDVGLGGRETDEEVGGDLGVRATAGEQ